jgi:hydroxymethylglutaryl-CoA lyase
VWTIDEVVEAVGLLESEDIHTISLADTVGLATPSQIRDVLSAVFAKYGYLEIGVHLHSRPDQAVERILAAYDAGCRRFDSAIGGLGGCPFAQDSLVGNIPTEKALEALQQRGVQPPITKSLDALLKATAGIQARFSESSAAD